MNTLKVCTWLLYFSITALCILRSYSDVTKISHRFMVKWSINKKDFFSTPSSYSDKCKCIQKKLYKFQGIENFDFYLCLKFNGNGYSIFIMNVSPEQDISDSMYLEYAFVASENSMFYLANSEDFQFRANYLYSSHINGHENSLFPNGTTTVNCLITANAHVQSTVSGKDTITCKSSISTKNSSSIPCDRRGRKEDDLTEYSFSGKIPTLSPQRAMNIIKQSYNLRKLNVTELRALSVEYLMQNLKAENVLDVLELSMKNGIENLKERCLSFLRSRCAIKSIYT